MADWIMRKTPFGQWIRKNCRPSSELSVTDFDYVFEDYKNKRLMLIEEKSNDTGGLKIAQKLTYRVVDRVLRQGCKLVGYEYYGMHVIKMSGNSPEDSETILWDEGEVTKEELLTLLNFEGHPEMYARSGCWD